jgi:hypothetical protein
MGQSVEARSASRIDPRHSLFFLGRGCHLHRIKGNIPSSNMILITEPADCISQYRKSTFPVPSAEINVVNKRGRCDWSLLNLTDMRNCQCGSD